MESSLRKKRETRLKRALRVRKRLRGTAECPRLCVVKTNAHIQVQLIDDLQGYTLGSVTTFSKEFRGGPFGRSNKTAATELGKVIARIAQEKGIQEVIFDRGASKYHGVIASLADAAREGGLRF